LISHAGPILGAPFAQRPTGANLAKNKNSTQA
jgi:hypothetical protein